MLSASVLYLISIVVLKAVAPQFKLDGFSKLYNFSQIILCGYMTWGFFENGFTLDNPFASNMKATSEIEWFMFVHYLSKFLDFFDTWIMIFKRNFRQLSFLHVYHHSSILLIWGYLLQRDQAIGTAYFGAFLNSIVHFVMYSHYLWTSFGFNNPFKKWITNMQLIQFFLCIAHAVYSLVYEEVLDRELAYLQFAYHLTMIALFSNFYMNTYGQLTTPFHTCTCCFYISKLTFFLSLCPGKKGEKGEKGAKKTE